MRTTISFGQTRRSFLLGATSLSALPFLPLSAAHAAGLDPFASPMNRGPSSLDVPAAGATPAASGASYLAPVGQGWSVTSLLTTGDMVNGYRMSGIPDGIGAFENSDGTLTVLMNHEIAGGKGPVRGHGGRGSYVSRWTLDKNTLEVKSGADFVTSPDKLHLWAGDSWTTGDKAPAAKLNVNRLCSADLAPESAFHNAATGAGYKGRIFLNGEEGGATSANRAFAFVVETGEAYELPVFSFGAPGDAAAPPPSWENLLAHPATGDMTLVAANSDGGANQVNFYIGRKTRQGSPVEMAGLTGGSIHSLLVPGVAAEDRNANIGLAKSLVGRGAGKPAALAAPEKGTSFLRPEDGAWDPSRPNVYYFVTTDRNNFVADGTARDGQDVKQVGRSRLWAVTFDDVTKLATDGSPVGKIELLLDGTEGGEMFDNVSMGADGFLTLCEDPGNSRHNGKVWSYDTATGALSQIAKFDPSKFGDVVGGVYTAPTAPFVDDKETSGVIDVTDLFSRASWARPGMRALLIVVQAHFEYDSSDAVGAGLVEGGQLLLLTKSA